MPTLNLPRKPKKANEEYTDNKNLRRKFYNTKQWRELRTNFLKLNPLCSDCLKNGKIVAAEDIHHLTSPFNYDAGEVNMSLALDPDNLVALCKQCHQARHNKKNNISPEEVLAQLEELMNMIED